MKKLTMKHSLLLALSTVLFSATAHAAPASPWKNGEGVVSFPNINDSHFTNPSIIDSDKLNLVDSNMSKWQVVRLIGRPHFAEGAFAETVWNYVFRFKQDDGSYKVCQYQVHFQRDQQNGQLLTNKDLYSTCHPTQVNKAPRMIDLSADALFAFAGSSLADLNPKGRAELDNVGKLLNDAYSNVSSIKIVGHTDRIGSDASNAALSIARANTVRSYLTGLGVPAGIMTTAGMGESQPVHTCSDNLPRAALIGCLAPNRRVSIQIDGTQKVSN